MKGKGKAAPAPELKDCPLQFPDLKPVDHARMCPRYTAVLGRSEDDGIGYEELDTLQTELETLLASVAKRMRQLENEIQVLTDWQDKKDKKGGKPEAVLPPIKRGKGAEERSSSKKFKDSSGKATIAAAQCAATAGRSKSKKNVQHAKAPDMAFVDSPVDLPRLPKNDTPNRFWATVEPYCADITMEDMKVLEEILRSHEDDAEYYKIPSLGKHYSHKWAQEDMIEEQREGKDFTQQRSYLASSKIENKRRGLSNNSSTNNNSTETTTMLRRAELNVLANDLEESPFGSLTQRLVSALIEENIMTPIDDSMNDANREALEANAAMSPRTLARQLNIGNTAHLERRLKRELEEQGLLEVEEKPPPADENPDDEILSELRKKQQELKALSSHNLHVTKRLYRLAKEEMGRQDMKKRVVAADADVMECYRRIQAARGKKRAPTKKEKDAVMRALKDREQLIKTLDTR